MVFYTPRRQEANYQVTIWLAMQRVLLLQQSPALLIDIEYAGQIVGHDLDGYDSDQRKEVNASVSHCSKF